MTNMEEMQERIAELERKIQVAIKYLQKQIDNLGYVEHMDSETTALKNEGRNRTNDWKCEVCNGTEDIRRCPIMTGGTFSAPLEEQVLVCMHCFGTWYDTFRPAGKN